MSRRLRSLSALRRNFDTPYEAMTAEAGWGEHYSEALIGREGPGPPVPDDAFVVGRRAVETYAFSDPRIVTGHFARDVPLLGRDFLLELKALGLRYLCGVRVTAVRDETIGSGGETRTVFGFRYDTLEGHLEAGAEWFLLTKFHATGDVRFRIQAAWREGTFPNLWTKLGFRFIGKRYQRAWHRLAYVRLRELTGDVGLPALPSADRILHSGPSLPNPGVLTLGKKSAHVTSTEHECQPTH